MGSLISDGCACKTAPHRRSTVPLLQRTRDFCAGFFHVEPSEEAHVNESCLCHRPCFRKTVFCLARLRRATETRYEAVYTNCHRWSGPAIHAESYLVTDAHLQAALRTAREDDELVLYLTYQPCHRSGGHRRAREQSCTLKLIDFYQAWLAPRGVRLRIKICYLYRAHWRGMEEYEPMIENAQKGIRLLMSHGIGLEAMGAADWQYLLTHTTPWMRHAWSSAAGPVYPDCMAQRMQMDAFVADFLDRIRSLSATVWRTHVPFQARWLDERTWPCLSTQAAPRVGQVRVRGKSVQDVDDAICAPCM
jgi:hypothetical protein